VVARTPRRSRWLPHWVRTSARSIPTSTASFTADPRIVPTAQRIERISNEEMLEMAASGAKILHLRCVEYAGGSTCRSMCGPRFSYREGTLLSLNLLMKKETMWKPPIIAGVAHDRSQAKITWWVCQTIPARPEIFQALADARSTST